jgi:ACT domain-containing protein
VRIVEQLAVFIANKPGTLVEVCEALAADRVNIYGLTISDTVDHAVVRMVVSDTRRPWRFLNPAAHWSLRPR